jgi:hypothetical protein
LGGLKISKVREPSSEDGSRRWQRAIPAALLLLCGVVLISLAVPRAGAAWAAMGARPAVDKALSGSKPTVAEFKACADSLESAARWNASARNTARRGYCELALAISAPAGSAERSAWTAQSERHVVEALTANPVDGAGWITLATVRTLRGAPGREVIEPLFASLDVAPNTQELWSARIDLFLRFWAFLKIDEMLRVRHQIRTIWSVPEQRQMMFDMASRYQRVSDLSWALNADKDALAELTRFRSKTTLPNP